MNLWFQNPPKLPNKPAAQASKGGALNKDAASNLYKKFLPAGQKEWDQDVIEAFYNELKIDAFEDIIVYLIAMHMKNAHMGVITEPEFIKGCENIGCADSIDKWRQ